MLLKMHPGEPPYLALTNLEVTIMQSYPTGFLFNYQSKLIIVTVTTDALCDTNLHVRSLWEVPVASLPYKSTNTYMTSWYKVVFGPQSFSSPFCQLMTLSGVESLLGRLDLKASRRSAVPMLHPILMKQWVWS